MEKLHWCCIDKNYGFTAIKKDIIYNYENSVVFIYRPQKVGVVCDLEPEPNIELHGTIGTGKKMFLVNMERGPHY